MNPVYILSDNMISALGFTTDEHLQGFRGGRSGIRLINDPVYCREPFYAALLNEETLEQEWEKTGAGAGYSKLEKVFIISIKKAISKTGVRLDRKDTLLLISTTKGNIGLLGRNGPSEMKSNRVFLNDMGNAVGAFFDVENSPVVLSNACVSGTLACNIAAQMVRAGKYKNVIVSGGDLVSEFIVSGFQSFKAIGTGPCRPFDKNRDGITLGDGAATLVFSADPPDATRAITCLGGASSNDANHISGPSREGDGLLLAVQKTIGQAGINAGDIQFISAHGTATFYNDEMEARAFNRAKLSHIPLNSFKGYFGHTLGAAGVLESAATVQSLINQEIFPNITYQTPGVTLPLNIIRKHESRPLNLALKTSSGFGGCNAACIFSRI